MNASSVQLLLCTFFGRFFLRKNNGPSKLVDGQSSLQQLKRQISKLWVLLVEKTRREEELLALKRTLRLLQPSQRLLSLRWVFVLKLEGPPFYSSIDSTTSFAVSWIYWNCFVNTCHSRGLAQARQFKRAQCVDFKHEQSTFQTRILPKISGF